MISIVVPVYNAARWLDRCVASLLGQTYADIEVLLIDDGSTDGSGKKCDKYAEEDKRVRVFHTENHGVSHARNIGIREARGEYLAFVDSDDWLERDILSRAVKRMLADNSRLSIYAMQIDRYTDDRVEKTPLSLSADETVTSQEIANRFGELFYQDYLSSACTKLFQKAIITDNGLLFDETLVMYEDLNFVLKYLSLIETVSLMKDIGYHYCMLTAVTSVTKRKTDRFLQNIHIVANGILDFLRLHRAELSDIDHKVIIDIYLIHLHRLFVMPHTFGERMRGIRCLFACAELNRSLQHCQLLKKQGRFYRFLARCLIKKWAFPIYILYRRRYHTR